jgi:hypothetical protein
MPAPIVFLDVDGPLIPFGGAGPRYPAVDPAAAGHPLLSRLAPGDGPRLLALEGELVWATTWQQEANEVIAPHLGLPVLPVVTWPDDEPDLRTACIGRQAGWSGGRRDGRSPGSTTRSPTPTAGGWRPGTRGAHCCTGSIRGPV